MAKGIPFVNNCYEDNSRDKAMNVIVDESTVVYPNCNSFLCTMLQLKESKKALFKNWLYNDIIYCHFCGQRINLFSIKDYIDNMKEEEGDW